jgi:beta-galactosidase
MINSKLPLMYYGGDYNPDQWPEEIWEEDMRLFKLAGINIITLPVFSWAKLQPSEDVYDFGWLDRVLDLAWKNGIYFCLATPTAAQPAWMSLKYPEILPVDSSGKKRTHGARVNFCPNSGKFRELAAKMAGKLAERYKDHPGLLVWHIGNEYGRYCWCSTCAAQFRNWLKDMYGTIEELNTRWNTGFWGHTFYSWEEIVPPSELNNDDRCYQSISLDYNRFMSDSSLGCYKEELKAIRRFSPDIPATTNFMAFFKPFDYFKWAEHMDVVSWDNYPSLDADMSDIAMKHDQMRGLKNGQPFMLMEQTPSQQNWQPYNSLKRPGVMRLWNYQAVAHGADTVMFFQLRRSRGACEKYHGAVIEHCGHENTRVFKECAQLGQEFRQLGGKLLDSRFKSRTAIMFDWDNWWAVEMSSGPSIRLKYIEQLEIYYKALYDMNIATDIIRPDSDLSKYDIVIAPVLYMVKQSVADNIEKFVAEGGMFITTFFSGLVDENDLVVLGGYPGKLRKLLGIWAEELDALLPDMRNSMIMAGDFGNVSGTYSCDMLCDLVNLEGAKALAVYGQDFYAGKPVVTENTFGKGKAYYVASVPENQFVKEFLKELCGRRGIKAPFDAPAGVEVTQRFKSEKEFTFVLNHNETSISVDLGGTEYIDLITGCNKTGKVELEPKGVLILEK